jgi:hypothetical protein
LKCLDEEGIFHFRDTLGYALFLARDAVAAVPRNNDMLSKTLEYAIFWAKVTVGSSDDRVAELEEHLQTIQP